MKVKEFIQKLNDIDYNDDTEIVFDLKNNHRRLYICQK